MAAPLWSWKINLNSATCFVVDNFVLFNFLSLSVDWILFPFSRLNFYVLVHCVITKFPRSVFKSCTLCISCVLDNKLFPPPERLPPGKTFLIPFCFGPPARPGPPPENKQQKSSRKFLLHTFFHVNLSSMLYCFCCRKKNSQTNNIFNELLLLELGKSLKALANLWPPSKWNHEWRSKLRKIAVHESNSPFTTLLLLCFSVRELRTSINQGFKGKGRRKVFSANPTENRFNQRRKKSFFARKSPIMTCVLGNSMLALYGELIY